MKTIFNYTVLLMLSAGLHPVLAQDSAASGPEVVHYSGHVLSNVDYHHGQLVPAVGVHSMQVLRANREHPELAEGSGFFCGPGAREKSVCSSRSRWRRSPGWTGPRRSRRSVRWWPIAVWARCSRYEAKRWCVTTSIKPTSLSFWSL